MSLKGLWNRIRGKPKEEDLLVVSLQTGETKEEEIGVAKLQERKPTIPKDKLQTLYETDPIVFRAIRKYVDAIASDYFLEGGDEEERKKLDKWIREKGFLFKIQDAIVDIFLCADAWWELIPKYSIKDLDIKPLNPKNVDFIRDTNGNVELDENGKPKGIIQQTYLEEIYWYKNKVETKSGKILLESETEDLRERIVNLNLFKYGESFTGYTPLLPVYKSAIIRLNMSDMIGESAFRGGGLVVYISGKPSQQTLDNLKKDLKNITTRNIFIFEDKIKLENIPIPDLSGRERLVYYYADEVAGGLGVPLCLMLSGASMQAREREQMSVDFELSIKPLQERLAYQIREKVFKKLWKIWGCKGEVPYIKFAERTPFAKLTRSRTIATLARRRLITYDPELEMRIRQELDLPTSFIAEEINKWKEEGKRPTPIGSDVDVYEK